MIMRIFNMTTLFVVPALIISACIITLIVYLTLIEEPYLSYQTLPIPVTLKTVRPGEIIPLNITRCNTAKERKVYTSTRLLENIGEDQEMLVMELVGVSLRPGCWQSVIHSHRIPDSAQPGRYRLVGVATVPGLIRNFLVSWYTEPFNVVAKPSATGLGKQ